MVWASESVFLVVVSAGWIRNQVGALVPVECCMFFAVPEEINDEGIHLCVGSDTNVLRLVNSLALQMYKESGAHTMMMPIHYDFVEENGPHTHVVVCDRRGLGSYLHRK